MFESKQGPGDGGSSLMSEKTATLKEIKLDDLSMVEPPIGSGAFGVVYRGTWRGAEVAIKKLRVEMMSEKELSEFRREALVMSTIGCHPNVLELCGIVVDPPSYCLVSPFCQNGSVWSYIKQNEYVPLETLLSFAKDGAAGLLHLHCENIVHRDVAARNFLLDDNLRAKLSDFGMSRILSSGSAKTRQDFGPLKYMAPECLADNEYSLKSDSFSFGIFLWEIITKEIPYPELEPVKAARLVVKEGLRPQIPSECPLVLAEIMRRCWKENPKDRPDMAQILKILDSTGGTGKKKSYHYSLNPRRPSIQVDYDAFPEASSSGESDTTTPVDNYADYHPTEKEPEWQSARLKESQYFEIPEIQGLEAYTANEENFRLLVQRIRDRTKGFDVRDRKYHLKTYPTCFIGSEATTWLEKNTTVRNREEAEELGNHLIRRRVLVHVVEETKRFIDGNFFYKFLDKRSLVVVGGGFAGSYVAKKLEAKLQVTLVDTKDFFEFTPGFPYLLRDGETTTHHSTSNKTEGGSGSGSPSLNARKDRKRIRVRHLDYLDFSQVVAVEGGVKEVAEREVVLSDGRVIPFDYLCVCTGAAYDYAKKKFDAEEVRARLMGRKDKGKHFFVDSRSYNDWAEILSTQQQKKSILEESQDIVIIGGGVVGVEVGAEVIARFPDKRITIIERGSSLMTRFPSEVSKAASDYFEKFSNVRILTNQTAVNWEEEGEVITEAGKRVKADLVFGCVGSSPRTGCLKKHFGRFLNDQGEVKVNSHFQMVTGGGGGGEVKEHIFCMGDIVTIASGGEGGQGGEGGEKEGGEKVKKTKRGLSFGKKKTPPLKGKEKEGEKEKEKEKTGEVATQFLSEERLASNALRHAEVVVENIKLLEKKKGDQLIAYKPSRGRPMVVSLGPQQSIRLKEKEKGGGACSIEGAVVCATHTASTTATSGNIVVVEGKGNMKEKHLVKLKGFRFS